MTDKDDKQDGALPSYAPIYGTEAPTGPVDLSKFESKPTPRKAPPLEGLTKELANNSIHPSHRIGHSIPGPVYCIKCSQVEPESLARPCTADVNLKDVGKKFDQEKPRWSLLPLSALKPVVQVLTNGAKKYADDNWKKVPNAKERYLSAALRHLEAYQSGEELDKEWGLPHLAHAICGLLFMLWLDQNVGHTSPSNDTK